MTFEQQVQMEMVYLYGQLQEWIRSARVQQAIMWLENEILQGRDAGEDVLSLVPTSQLQGSPLLLKAGGEHHYRSGRLLEAKRDLALAVKGFAAQAFRRPLLSAMALWADLLLRTGNLSSAETILQFLQEEYERSTGMELDGQVPYALGRGEWLLRGSSGAKALKLSMPLYGTELQNKPTWRSSCSCWKGGTPHSRQR